MQKNEEINEEIKNKLIALKKLSQVFIIKQKNNNNIDQLLKRLIRSSKTF